MNTNLSSKIILFFSYLGLFCLAGCSTPSILINPDNNLEKICSFEIPEDYELQFVVELDGNPMISMNGPEASDHIYLVQLPEGVEINLDDLDQPIGVMVGHQEINANETTLVERKTVSICGQDVPLMVSEGVNAENQSYRQNTAVFQGKNGLALVNLTATVERWNQPLVDEFLASLQ